MSISNSHTEIGNGGTMNKTLSVSRRWLLTLLPQSFLTACAMGQPKYYFHSFDFNVDTDAKVYGHPDIEVLDYEYGSSGQLMTRPSKVDWEMKKASGTDSFSQVGTAGMMPRGEYLYVKWRVKATGAVYEDRVDLTKRLPVDITKYGIHFAVYGTQLYVYAFPPFKEKDALGVTIVNVGQPPGHERGVEYYLPDIPYARKYQIYPDVEK